MHHLWTNISQMTRGTNLTIVRTGCQTVHFKSEICSLTREFLRKIHHFPGYLSGWIVLIIIKVKFSQLWLDRSGQPVLSKGKHAAYVASVSVWFRSKGLGTIMKDCTKNGVSKREGRWCKSCSSMFISLSVSKTTQKRLSCSLESMYPRVNFCWETKLYPRFKNINHEIEQVF